ncbi:hypothetical protein BJX64DRAFT_274826 [Aspergillus heterothallicus]
MSSFHNDGYSFSRVEPIIFSFLNTIDDTVGGALQALSEKFDTLVATNTGLHGEISPKTTFSIALFLSDSEDVEGEPFFRQYHHIAPWPNRSLTGSHTDDLVTKHLPELANGAGSPYTVDHVLWDDVTVGQLASHISGIAMDSPLQDTRKPCCGEGPKCSSIVRKAFQDIFDILDMAETSIFAPVRFSTGIIPVSKETSGCLKRNEGEEASTFLFSTSKDLAASGQAILNSTLLDKATTNRWLKPVSHTSNPANSSPNTSMVDVYTVLSNEGCNESLYSSYLALVPDFGIGFAIISADPVAAADLNTHAVIIAGNFGGAYRASSLTSSITVAYDTFPGSYCEKFISNGTHFRETLANILDIDRAGDLSICLYPTVAKAFRPVFRDKTELTNNGTPTWASWLELDKYRYGGRGLDEFIFSLDSNGRAVSVEIPALKVEL